MKILMPLITLSLLSLTSFAQAGTLTNGQWAPANCGTKPAVPVIDDQSVDSYNKSITAVNEWQQTAKTYYGCIVSEANADNAAIAQKANAEQTGYKADFETIKTAIDAGKKKLDGK